MKTALKGAAGHEDAAIKVFWCLQRLSTKHASHRSMYLDLCRPESRYSSSSMTAAHEMTTFGLQAAACFHPCSVLKRRLRPLIKPLFFFLPSSQAAAPIRFCIAATCSLCELRSRPGRRAAVGELLLRLYLN